MRGAIFTDLRHFLDDQGRIGLPRGPGRQLAEFLANIVATMTHDFDSPLAPIRCRRRPGRKLCPGLVDATFTTDDGILWRCKQCGDQGVVTNWQNTFWDLSDAPVAEQSSR